MLRMIQLLLGSMAFVLSGCIYLPIIEPEPYKEDQLTLVHVGDTTRQELVDTFGPEYIERDGSSIWIYGLKRHVGYLILIGKPPSAFYIDDYQFIVVEFEQDIVKSFELMEDVFGCSSTGICLHSGWKYTESGLLTDDQVLVASRRNDDRMSKEFQNVRDKCSLYVYQEYPFGRVAVDSLKNVLIDDETYIHVLIHHGRFSITAAHSLDRKGKEIVTEHFECAPEGGPLFVKVADKAWSWGLNPTITAVGQDVGREAIMKRSLILPP
jgi:hypothetical protein